MQVGEMLMEDLVAAQRRLTEAKEALERTRLASHASAAALEGVEAAILKLTHAKHEARLLTRHIALMDEQIESLSTHCMELTMLIRLTPIHTSARFCGMETSEIKIRFNRAVWRMQQRLGVNAKWLPPVHGARVLVNDRGEVCAQVRELGMARPKKDRRYAAKIEGVEWWTTNVLITSPKFLPLMGFETAKEAMTAVETARTIILNASEDDGTP